MTDPRYLSHAEILDLVDGERVVVEVAPGRYEHGVVDVHSPTGDGNPEPWVRLDDGGYMDVAFIVRRLDRPTLCHHVSDTAFVVFLAAVAAGLLVSVLNWLQIADTLPVMLACAVIAAAAYGVGYFTAPDETPTDPGLNVEPPCEEDPS
jgi:hypothetical protein